MRRWCDVLAEDQVALACQSIDFCLGATDVFEEWEFDTIFGFSRSALAEWAHSWSSREVDDTGVERLQVVVGQLLGYPGARGRFGESKSERLISLEERLRELG